MYCTVLFNEIRSGESSLRPAPFCIPVLAGLGLYSTRSVPDPHDRISSIFILPASFNKIVHVSLSDELDRFPDLDLRLRGPLANGPHISDVGLDRSSCHWTAQRDTMVMSRDTMPMVMF